MAQSINVRLSRTDNSPWGFRLQGGKDFGQPLLIQKVNGGTPAERAGLQVGDALLRVNNVDVSDMRHKEAQDTIIKAGNSFELALHRGGGSVWKPQVSPVGQVPQPGKCSPATTVTKTSLAAGRSPVPQIGAGHNLSPKPFPAQVNGDGSVKAIVNKQYNTPVQMYSEDSIAETLSAQAEVLAGGAIGVNFMKNEKSYDSQKSEVFKMVQEVDKEPHYPETPGPSSSSKYFSTTSHAIGGRATSPRPLTPLAKEMGTSSPLPGVQENPPCSACGKHIVGVFVRIKDKNLHVECFKCATCGTSLKNVGYYTINNKLYCDIHAKMVARQNPPAPNLEPVAVPPGGRAPAGAFFTPQAAAPQSPQASTLAPLPFHSTAPSGPKAFSSVSAPNLPSSVPYTPSAIAPPTSTPFSSIPPPPAPLAPIKPALEEERPCSPLPNRGVSLEEVEQSVVAAGERIKRLSPRPPSSPRPSSRSPSPRTMTPRHFKVEDPDLLDISTKPHGVYSLLPPACLIRPMSPKQVVVYPPELPAVIYSRSPTPRHKEKRSPERCATCPSPLNAVVPYKEKQEIKVLEQPKEKHSTKGKESPMKSEISKKESKQSKEQKSHHHETTKKSETHSTKEQKIEKSSKAVNVKQEVAHEVNIDKMFFSKSEVEKIIHEEVLRALSMQGEAKHVEEVKEVEVSVHDLPKPIAPSGWMTSALTTASERPFTPVPFPKPMELPSISERIIPMEPMELKPVPLPTQTKPYFPPPPPPPDKEALDERTARALREVGCRSPMEEALTVASDRPYSPLLTQTSFKPIPKKEMSLASALTVAPSMPFTVPGKTPIPSSEDTGKPSEFKSIFSRDKEKHGIDMTRIAEGGHMKETVKNFECGKVMKSVQETTHSEKHLIPHYQENIGEIPIRNRSISPVPHRIVAPSIKPTASYIPQPYTAKQEARVSRKDAHEQSMKMQSDKVQILHTKNLAPRPTTPSGLHAPQELPYYQQNIGVIPLRNKSISPVPHIIKAPQLDPAPPMVQQGYKSTVYSETKTYSAQKSSSKSLTTNVTTKAELKPPAREPSPQTWKMETKRTVQNLSPITVRLPSPRRVTPVQGETEQAANVKVEIHRPRPSSPLPPKIKVQVDYPTVPSLGPSIGSKKSAFAPVKNGNSQVKKPTDLSTPSQKESCPAKCNEVCQKKTCDSQACTKKESCCHQVSSQAQSAQSTHITSTVAEKLSSSEVVQQKSSIQRKAVKSGNTSFRAYGETSNRTLKVEDDTRSIGSMKMEHALESKTFVETTNGGKKGVVCDSRGQKTGGCGGGGCDRAVAPPASNLLRNAPLPTFPSLPPVSDIPPPPGAPGRGTQAGATAPKRGRGVLNQGVAPGGRIPLCGLCNNQIRGPFITALGKIWCPEHFVCVNAKCKRPLQDIGFVEEQDGLYCEFCFEQYLAPTCDKCHSKIKQDCLNAIGRHFHPECFSCSYCGKLFGNNPFFLEDALPYCENDWNELFTTKCFSCGFPIEAGDRWVEALSNNYHSQCFNCSMCKKNLEGQSFFAKGGRPFCKNHAR